MFQLGGEFVFGPGLLGPFVEWVMSNVTLRLSGKTCSFAHLMQNTADREFLSYWMSIQRFVPDFLPADIEVADLMRIAGVSAWIDTIRRRYTRTRRPQIINIVKLHIFLIALSFDSSNTYIIQVKMTVNESRGLTFWAYIGARNTNYKTVATRKPHWKPAYPKIQSVRHLNPRCLCHPQSA